MLVLSESSHCCLAVLVLRNISISLWLSVSQLRCPPLCRRPWWKSSTPRSATSPLCTEAGCRTTWCVRAFCKARWTRVRSVLFPSHVSKCSSMNVNFIFLLAAQFWFLCWPGLVFLILNRGGASGTLFILTMNALRPRCHFSCSRTGYVSELTCLCTFVLLLYSNSPAWLWNLTNHLKVHKLDYFVLVVTHSFSPSGRLWRPSGVRGRPRTVLPGGSGELGCWLCPDQQAWGLLPCYQAPQLDSEPHRSRFGPWVLGVCLLWAASPDRRKLRPSAPTQTFCQQCGGCSIATW